MENFLVTEINYNDILDQFDANDPERIPKALGELIRVSQSYPDDQAIIVMDIPRLLGSTLKPGQRIAVTYDNQTVILAKGDKHEVDFSHELLDVNVIDSTQHEESNAKDGNISKEQ